MPPEEANRFSQLERNVRDQQEDYWRAFEILNRVVERAGHTRSAETLPKKLFFACAKSPPTDFGRLQQIRSADIRLSKWLQEDTR